MKMPRALAPQMFALRVRLWSVNSFWRLKASQTLVSREKLCWTERFVE